jgi:hypothetical protein
VENGFCLPPNPTRSAELVNLVSSLSHCTIALRSALEDAPTNCVLLLSLVFTSLSRRSLARSLALLAMMILITSLPLIAVYITHMKTSLLSVVTFSLRYASPLKGKVKESAVLCCVCFSCALLRKYD